GAADHRVDNHSHIGIGRNSFLAVTLMKFDLVVLEKDRHLRINTFVRPADLESALLQRHRHRAHGRAANPNEMKFLRRALRHAHSLRRASDFGYSNEATLK